MSQLTLKPLLVVILLAFILAGCTPAQTPSTTTVPATATSTSAPSNSPDDSHTPAPASPTPQIAQDTSPTATATLHPTVEPSPTQPILPDSPAIIIDHTAVELFDQIPPEYIQKASQLRLMVRHASIGENIRYGLECLQGAFPGRRPNSCGDFYDPSLVYINWVFQFRGNPGWIEKVNDYVDQTNAQLDQYDVFMFLFAYADAIEGSTYPVISEPENFQTLYIDKVEALEAAHPDKLFPWVTTSVARVSFGNTQRLLDMTRQYAIENGKILFDLADIESHDPDGNPVRDSNGYEILWEGCTKETQGGHLNEVCRERVAKAFWVLMAYLAGWEGPQS